MEIRQKEDRENQTASSSSDSIDADFSGDHSDKAHFINDLQLFTDDSRISSIRQTIDSFEKELAANRRIAKKLELKQELKEQIDRNQETFSHINDCINDGQLELKKRLDRQLLAKDKQMAAKVNALKKSKKQVQNAVQKGIEELKLMKNATEKKLAAETKETTCEIRKGLSELTKDLRSMKKERVESRESLFDSIESMRLGILRKMQAEEAKRGEYNKMVGELLEKTCRNAEVSIRRRVL